MNPLLYHLALSQVSGVGPQLAKLLISHEPDISRIFELSYKQLLAIPGIGSRTALAIKQFKPETVMPLLKQMDEENIQALVYGSPEYPFRLRQIPDAPLILFAQGDEHWSAERTLAVVGTRSMTHYGRSMVGRLLEPLKDTRLVTISGLAMGVDQHVHQLSLDLGIPTLAVLGNGLPQIYPKRHHQLGQRIRNEGALLSEFPPGAAPRPEHFPRRNRIIAGLADVVVVIESANKGGSLITAHLANQYQREVMAVPGPVGAQYSSGCNRLIRTHAAHLIETADDLLSLMNWDQHSSERPNCSAVRLTDGQQHVLTWLIEQGKSNFDQLQEAFPQLHELSHILLELELKNCISSLPGNSYCAH